MGRRGSTQTIVTRALLTLVWVVGLAVGAREVIFDSDRIVEARSNLLDDLREHVRTGRLEPEWMIERLGAASAAEREELWSTLARSQDESLRAALVAGARALAAASDPDASPDETRAARAVVGLEVLGALGTAEDLSLSGTLALDGAGTSRDGELARAYERAAHGILARDEQAWSRLDPLLDELPLGLVERLLAVVGQSDSPRVLATLPSFLGRGEDLDAATLSNLARVLRRAAGSLGPSSLAHLRTFLGSRHGPTREQAALVAGWLEDEESTSTLLSLLEDESSGVRTSARWALERISGLSYRVEDPRWRHWYDGELVWWAEAAPALLQDLRSSDRAELVAAVHELAQRRLFRKDLVQALAPMTRDPDHDLAALACDALGALASRTAVPALLEALQRPEPAVRESAGAALTRITGLKAPADHESWMRALEPGGRS